MEEITTDLMYRLLVQGVSDYAIYMLDADGVVLNWNAGAEKAKGYAASEVVGRNYEIFFQDCDRRSGLPQRNLERARSGERVSDEGWRRRKDGSLFWASVTVDRICDCQGKFVGFAKITRDLTEQRRLMAKIEHAATHDPLTGVENRAGLLASLRDAFDAGRSFALHCVDLDHFKPVNDRLGHSAGDAVLREVGSRLAGLAGAEGSAARLGGDEFALLNRQDTCHRERASTAQAIVALLSAPFDIEGERITIGASVGTACAPEHGDGVASLLRSADEALYEAKRAGRNRAVAANDCQAPPVSTGFGPEARAPMIAPLRAPPSRHYRRRPASTSS